jgi:hypothetical protein
MSGFQMAFVILATDLFCVALNFERIGRLSRAKRLFRLNHVFHEHKPKAQMFLLSQYTFVIIMASLLNLPTELLHNVLVRLEQEDLKEFRSVSHESCARVTPILFNKVHFDFDLSGTNSLVSISRRPHLAAHVKTIELQRRSGLKKFVDFWTWQQANIYEYQPLIPRDGGDEVGLSEDIMSANDWHHMTDESRRALFDDYQDDYEDDYGAITRQTSQLAFAMSSAIQQSHGYVPELQNATEAQQTIREFNAAVQCLRNITSFHHYPAYDFDDWGERWRQIQFHRDALILESGFGDDVDADSLQ